MADEYIRREDARRAVIGRGYNIRNVYSHNEELIFKRIDRIPAADVAPVVRGKWVDGHCDKCGCYGAPTFDGDNEKTAFCPNCGARMDARKEPTNEPQA